LHQSRSTLIKGPIFEALTHRELDVLDESNALQGRADRAVIVVCDECALGLNDEIVVP
jgi:hypothetical protein